MNKRFGFIRGRPFTGLEDYFASEELEVKNKDIKYVINSHPNYSLKNPPENVPPSYSKKVACFYEILAQGIYGGKRTKKYLLENDNGFSMGFIPDLINGNRIWDSKASAARQHIKLKDEQLMKYSLFQMKSEEPPNIKIDIFRHGINNMNSKFIDRPLKEFVFQLTKDTRSMVSLDLSVIFEYYRMAHKTKHLKLRYDKGLSYTKISPVTLNNFIAYPEKTVEELGFDLKDIEIKKRRFPSDVKVNGYEMNSFPVVIIENKNYPEKWTDYFNTVIEDGTQVPSLFMDLWNMKKTEYEEGFEPCEDDAPF